MSQETVKNSITYGEAVTIPRPAEMVVREERDRILLVISQQLNQALLAPPLPGEAEGRRDLLRQQVIVAFVRNFERFTTADLPIERLMALQVASETVLAGVDATVREQYMTQIARIDINAPVVERLSEPRVSTAELEVMTDQVTDESVSPPRGIAIERMQSAMRKATSYVMSRVVSH